MSVTLIIVVLVAALGAVAGIAYTLDRRRGIGSDQAEEAALGPAGRVLLWVNRGLAALVLQKEDR